MDKIWSRKVHEVVPFTEIIADNFDGGSVMIPESERNGGPIGEHRPWILEVLKDIIQQAEIIVVHGDNQRVQRPVEPVLEIKKLDSFEVVFRVEHDVPLVILLIEASEKGCKGKAIETKRVDIVQKFKGFDPFLALRDFEKSSLGH